MCKNFKKLIKFEPEAEESKIGFRFLMVLVTAEDKIVVFAFLRKLTEKMYENVAFWLSFNIFLKNQWSWKRQCCPDPAFYLNADPDLPDADAGQTFYVTKV